LTTITNPIGKLASAMSFNFLAPDALADERLRLHLRTTESAAESIWKAPTYRFDIQIKSTGQTIGYINLRVGDSNWITKYVGHIGYGIDQPHRGHHHAEQACRILLPFAKQNGLQTLWITCSPDNLPSRRTLERLEATYIETVSVPDEYPLPEGALREKRRYRIEG
jgi:predicted acetyltransferase